jgi:hypothetical protein
VRILSPSSAGTSTTDPESEATVKVDCVESLETFELLYFLGLVLLTTGLCL